SRHAGIQLRPHGRSESRKPGSGGRTEQRSSNSGSPSEWHSSNNGTGRRSRLPGNLKGFICVHLCSSVANMTLSEKIWNNHIVFEEKGAPSLLYIDLHIVHEVTSPQAFSGLRARGLKVRRPDRTLGTVDHSIPTTDRSLPIVDEIAAKQVSQFELNCKEFGIPAFGAKSEHQGICHVIGPEMGATQPGMTIVCGDSHTATHGAFGALAFGIG